jgi:hypothetical protein
VSPVTVLLDDPGDPGVLDELDDDEPDDDEVDPALEESSDPLIPSAVELIT